MVELSPVELSLAPVVELEVPVASVLVVSLAALVDAVEELVSSSVLEDGPVELQSQVESLVLLQLEVSLPLPRVPVSPPSVQPVPVEPPLDSLATLVVALLLVAAVSTPESAASS